MTPQRRLHRLGWFAALALCAGLYLALHVKVNAVHSDVVSAERQIIALEQEKIMLETEFQTRSSQHQLAIWNRVDFGYAAPTADQFLDNERQLAQLGVPRAKDAPAPIRFARNDVADEATPFPQFVSPLTGRPLDEDLVEPGQPERTASLAARFDGPTRIPLGAVLRGEIE